jgi:hypothetical protein
MLTKELKKGMVVRLRNGWLAKCLSDLRTYTPVCEVVGFETESGSVYAHDMMQVYVSDKTGLPFVADAGQTADVIETVPGHWMDIEHTEKQLQMKKNVDRMF